MKQAFKPRRTLIAAAVAMALSAPAMAQQLVIDQRMVINEEFAQTADNAIDIESFGGNALLNLGLDATGIATVGSTQFAGQQAMAIGFGAISANPESALDVSALSTLIRQGMSPDSDIDQRIRNVAQVDADNGGEGPTAVAAVRGLSQIGANLANGAALNLTQGGTIELQQLLRGSTTIGAVTNQAINNAIVAEVYNGDAIVDGANGTGLASSSTQYATNVANSVQLNATTDFTAKLQQTAGTDSDFPTRGTYRSTSTNTILAYATNDVRPDRPVDPMIRNMDQLVVTSVNSLAASNSGTTTLTGAGNWSDGYSGVTEQSIEVLGLYYQYNDSTVVPSNLFGGGNEAVAWNGGSQPDYDTYSVPSRGAWGLDSNSGGDITVGKFQDGGFGDSIIDKVGQTIVTSINSVSVTGPRTTTTTNGVTTTTTALAGPTRVGSVSVYDPLVSPVDLAVETFDQVVSNVRITPRYRVDNLDLDSESSGRIIDVNQDGTGNLAFAFTGFGTARVSAIDQVQSVTLNAFSTTGDLIGATIAGTVAELGLAQGGYQVTGGASAPSLRQDSINSQVWLENVGMAVSYNRAIASGSQTLVSSINSLSVGGALSGNYQQRLLGDESIAASGTELLPSGEEGLVRLQNTLVAVSQNGSATIGDFVENGVMKSSPVAQTIVSSINTMTLGSVGTANIQQINAGTDDVLQRSSNLAIAYGGTSSSVSNINQTVLNKINTIGSLNR